MNAAQSESEASGAEANVSDAELHRLASQLDVYRHERLAYTEIPDPRAKVKFRRPGRLRAIYRCMLAWFRSFGF